MAQYGYQNTLDDEALVGELALSNIVLFPSVDNLSNQTSLVDVVSQLPGDAQNKQKLISEAIKRLDKEVDRIIPTRIQPDYLDGDDVRIEQINLLKRLVLTQQIVELSELIGKLDEKPEIASSVQVFAEPETTPSAQVLAEPEIASSEQTPAAAPSLPPRKLPVSLSKTQLNIAMEKLGDGYTLVPYIDALGNTFTNINQGNKTIAKWYKGAVVYMQDSPGFENTVNALTAKIPAAIIASSALILGDEVSNEQALQSRPPQNQIVDYSSQDLAMLMETLNGKGEAYSLVPRQGQPDIQDIVLDGVRIAAWQNGVGKNGAGSLRYRVQGLFSKKERFVLTEGNYATAQHAVEADSLEVARTDSQDPKQIELLNQEPINVVATPEVVVTSPAKLVTSTPISEKREAQVAEIPPAPVAYAAPRMYKKIEYNLTQFAALDQKLVALAGYSLTSSNADGQQRIMINGVLAAAWQPSGNGSDGRLTYFMDGDVVEASVEQALQTAPVAVVPNQAPTIKEQTDTNSAPAVKTETAAAALAAIAAIAATTQVKPVDEVKAQVAPNVSEVPAAASPSVLETVSAAAPAEAAIEPASAAAMQSSATIVSEKPAEIAAAAQVPEAVVSSIAVEPAISAPVEAAVVNAQPSASAAPAEPAAAPLAEPVVASSEAIVTPSSPQTQAAAPSEQPVTSEPAAPAQAEAVTAPSEPSVSEPQAQTPPTTEPTTGGEVPESGKSEPKTSESGKPKVSNFKPQYKSNRSVALGVGSLVAAGASGMMGFSGHSGHDGESKWPVKKVACVSLCAVCTGFAAYQFLPALRAVMGRA